MNTHSDPRHSETDTLLRATAQAWRSDFVVPPAPDLPSAPPREADAQRRRPAWTRPVLLAGSMIAAAALTIGITQGVGRPSAPATAPSPSPSATAASPDSSPTSSGDRPDRYTWPADTTAGRLEIVAGEPPAAIDIDGYRLTRRNIIKTPVLALDSDDPTLVRAKFISPGTGIDQVKCGSFGRIYVQRDSVGTITVTAVSYSADFGQLCPLPAVLPSPMQGRSPFPLTAGSLLDGSTGQPVDAVDLSDFAPPGYLPKGFTLGAGYEAYRADRNGRESDTVSVARWLTPPKTATPAPCLGCSGITITWEMAPRTVLPAEWLCAVRTLADNRIVAACEYAAGKGLPTVPLGELQRVVDSIPG